MRKILTILLAGVVSRFALPSAFSTYLAREILDHILRNEAWTAPSSVFIALFEASTGLEENTIATATEATYTSYARLEVGGATGRSFIAADASDHTDNNEVWTFPQATGDGTNPITHFAVMDLVTLGSGNILFWGALNTPKQINNGDTPRFNAGELDITVQ